MIWTKRWISAFARCQIGGAGFDALLQAGVQHAHLRPRPAQFARVTHDGDSSDADHDDDHDAADDREQPKQGRVCPLLGDAGGQAFVGGADDAGEEYIGFVHQRLAAIGPDQRERVRVLVIALHGDGQVHLGELLVDDGREALERCAGAVIGSQQAVDRRQLPLGQRLGRAVGCEIDLVAGVQKPALAGFGGLHRVAQIDGGAARIARGDDFVEIDLRALAQPERHADDAEQREKSDQQQRRGGLNEETTGNGHAFTTARNLVAAPADLRPVRPLPR